MNILAGSFPWDINSSQKWNRWVKGWVEIKRLWYISATPLLRCVTIRSWFARGAYSFQAPLPYPAGQNFSDCSWYSSAMGGRYLLLLAGEWKKELPALLRMALYLSFGCFPKFDTFSSWLCVPVVLEILESLSCFSPKQNWDKDLGVNCLGADPRRHRGRVLGVSERKERRGKGGCVNEGLLLG